jgi:nucleoside-diphosphate-sugar epimerase
MIYAKDLALLIDNCLQQVADGFHTYNAANPQTVSVRELSDAIHSCLKRPGHIPSLPAGIVSLAARFAQVLLGKKSPLTPEQVNKLMANTTCCMDKTVAATGFVPSHSLSESLNREINWAKTSGILSS